jgi:hypothetical protein
MSDGGCSVLCGYAVRLHEFEFRPRWCAAGEPAHAIVCSSVISDELLRFPVRRVASVQPQQAQLHQPTQTGPRYGVGTAVRTQALGTIRVAEQ